MFLVTGANGQLGQELRLILGDKAVYVDFADLDITDTMAVKAFCKDKAFEAIINCAAYTAVDRAESEPEKARAVNADGPRNLAETGIPMIHISTDYVFDGQSCRPYKEDDLSSPRSIYGRTKLAGEQAVLECSSAAFVFRTSWLYSPFGNNFVKTMLRLGAEREMLKVVFDQVGTPTYAAHLAQAIVNTLPHLKKGRKEVYHFSNEGVCSWYDFAVEIMVRGGRNCKVLPIESKDYPTAAERPAFSVLNKEKFKTSFGAEIPHWTKGLEECLKRF